LHNSTVKVNGISKLRVIEVEREFPFPIERVWDALYVGFGEGYKFNPHWVKTSWVGDIQEAKVGAVRVMQNDEKGKQILHERILYLNKEERSLRFEIFKAKGVPLDTEAAFGESQLIKISGNSTLFKIKFYYRTSPKFLANFAHKRLKGELEDMTIGMEHFISTGENVTKENFDSIAERYN